MCISIHKYIYIYTYGVYAFVIIFSNELLENTFKT